MSEEHEYPSLAQQAKNLANFSFEVVKNALDPTNDVAMILVSDEVKEERLEICRQCEYYDENQVRCKQCGCWLEHKAKFALDSCPVGKWRTIGAEESCSPDEFKEALKKQEEMRFPENYTGPRFPHNPQLGDVYECEQGTWQFDGRIWRHV